MYTAILGWASAGTTEPESVQGIRASETLRNSSSTVAPTEVMLLALAGSANICSRAYMQAWRRPSVYGPVLAPTSYTWPLLGPYPPVYS